MRADYVTSKILRELGAISLRDESRYIGIGIRG